MTDNKKNDKKSNQLFFTKQKKRGFTLIEILFVIVMLAILFLARQNGFKGPTIDKTQAKSCLQRSHGQVQSFLYTALMQKGITLQTGIIFPEKYEITFDVNNQNIQLIYNNDLYQQIDFNHSEQGKCTHNQYTIIMTGENVSLNIQNTQIQSAVFYGDIGFLFCTQQECDPLATIHYDTRTKQIRLYICPDNQGFCL